MAGLLDCDSTNIARIQSGKRYELLEVTEKSHNAIEVGNLDSHVLEINETNALKSSLRDRTGCRLMDAQGVAAADKERIFAATKLKRAIVICVCFMLLEIVGGHLAGSLAIFADAAHMLSDVAGFVISLLALQASGWLATSQHSFGYFRLEVLGALVSVQIIWVMTGIIVYEACQRLYYGIHIVDGRLMFSVACVGLVLNLVMIFVLGHGHDCNDGSQWHGHSHSHCSGKERNHGRVHNHSAGTVAKHDTLSNCSGKEHNHARAHNHSHDIDAKHGTHSHCSGEECFQAGVQNLSDDVDTEHCTHSHCSGKDHNYARVQNHSDESDVDTKHYTHSQFPEKEHNHAQAQKLFDGIDGKRGILKDSGCSHSHGNGHDHSRISLIELSPRPVHEHGKDIRVEQIHKAECDPLSNGKHTDQEEHDLHKDDIQLGKSIHFAGLDSVGVSQIDIHVEELLFSQKQLNPKSDNSNSRTANCHVHVHLSHEQHDSHVHLHDSSPNRDDHSEVKLSEVCGDKSRVGQDALRSMTDSTKEKFDQLPGKVGQLSNGSKVPTRNINLQGAYLHALGDLIQNIGVLISGLVIWCRPEWQFIDLLCSFVFSILVMMTTLKMVKDIVWVLMESASKDLDVRVLKSGLLQISGVTAVLDLHVWALTPGTNLLSCHIEIKPGSVAKDVLHSATEYCVTLHHIKHVTIQIEDGP